MEIIRIDHIGLVPKDMSLAYGFFQNILNLEQVSEEMVENQQVNASILQCENSRLELLSPTEPSSPIAKFLEKKGAGIHHIALRVDNLEEWIVHLKENGAQLIDEKPQLGAHNTKIIFVHPRSTGGILVELIEEMK